MVFQRLLFADLLNGGLRAELAILFSLVAIRFIAARFLGRHFVDIDKLYDHIQAGEKLFQ